MNLLADVAVAVRSLRRRPAYAVMAVVVLALGIGANAAMFSVVDTVLLRPLPYADPDALVVLFGDGTARGQNSRQGLSAADVLGWREQGAGALAGIAALRNESRRVTSAKEPVVPLVHAVSANYFDVLRAAPLLGRTFAAGEDAPGAAPVVVLSHGIWQTVFGGRPEVVGSTITLDDAPFTVVGVMGPDFHTSHFIPVQPGLWLPTSLEAVRAERTRRDLLAYARLAPGQSAESAQATLRAISARLAADHPDSHDRWSAAVVPMREQAVGAFSRTGAILLAAVGLVLLIACANVANLTLARTTERAQEVAVRTVMGASRSRLVAQLMVESLLLAAAGGVLGAGVAWLGAGHLARLIPAQANIPFLDRVAVDERVLVFTFGVSMLAGVVFGLIPSLQATRLDLMPALRERSRNVGGTARRLREALVVGEVALAVVIVSAAGLMLQTFTRLQRVPPGFDAAQVLKIRTGVRGGAFETPAARVAHFLELKRRLEQVPGISSASAVSFEPPAIPASTGVFGAVPLALPGNEDVLAAPSAVSRTVLPDYFATMGIPVVRGRAVDARDTADGAAVAVISETMARRYFPGVDPLGRSFSVQAPNARPLEIVGVVGDVITGGVDPTPQPTFYTPYTQSGFPVMSVVMRVPQGDPMAVAREAERVAWSIAPSVNVYGTETLDRRLVDLNWRARFGALLLGGFAALALLIGAAGIYAVVSYTVTQRRAEIGLRMALGAQSSDVVGMVLKGGVRLAGVGLAAGALASTATTRVLGGFLYGVTPGDPATLAAVAALLLAVTVGACLAPALRASRVDPQVVLRD